MADGTNNPKALDPRTLGSDELAAQLKKINGGELPVTVWLPDYGMVEVIQAVRSTIYVDGKPRLAVGLVTAREA